MFVTVGIDGDVPFVVPVRIADINGLVFVKEDRAGIPDAAHRLVVDIPHDMAPVPRRKVLDFRSLFSRVFAVAGALPVTVFPVAAGSLYQPCCQFRNFLTAVGNILRGLFAIEIDFGEMFRILGVGEGVVVVVVQLAFALYVDFLHDGGVLLIHVLPLLLVLGCYLPAVDARGVHRDLPHFAVLEGAQGRGEMPVNGDAVFRFLTFDLRRELHVPNAFNVGQDDGVRSGAVRLYRAEHAFCRAPECG